MAAGIAPYYIGGDFNVGVILYRTDGNPPIIRQFTVISNRVDVGVNQVVGDGQAGAILHGSDADSGAGGRISNGIILDLNHSAAADGINADSAKAEIDNAVTLNIDSFIYPADPDSHPAVIRHSGIIESVGENIRRIPGVITSNENTAEPDALNGIVCQGKVTAGTPSGVSLYIDSV